MTMDGQNDQDESVCLKELMRAPVPAAILPQPIILRNLRLFSLSIFFIPSILSSFLLSCVHFFFCPASLRFLCLFHCRLLLAVYFFIALLAAYFRFPCASPPNAGITRPARSLLV